MSSPFCNNCNRHFYQDQNVNFATSSSRRHHVQWARHVLEVIHVYVATQRNRFFFLLAFILFSVVHAKTEKNLHAAFTVVRNFKNVLHSIILFSSRLTRKNSPLDDFRFDDQPPKAGLVLVRVTCKIRLFLKTSLSRKSLLNPYSKWPHPKFKGVSFETYFQLSYLLLFYISVPYW